MFDWAICSQSISHVWSVGKRHSCGTFCGDTSIMTDPVITVRTCEQRVNLALTFHSFSLTYAEGMQQLSRHQPVASVETNRIFFNGTSMLPTTLESFSTVHHHTLSRNIRYWVLHWVLHDMSWCSFTQWDFGAMLHDITYELCLHL